MDSTVSRSDSGIPLYPELLYPDQTMRYHCIQIKQWDTTVSRIIVSRSNNGKPLYLELLYPDQTIDITVTRITVSSIKWDPV